MVEGAAGVEDDFGAGFFGQGRGADFCEFLRHVFQYVIRNDNRITSGFYECFGREGGVRSAGTDRADCGARASDASV